MSLEAEALASLVYVDHLTAFPTAAGVVRKNVVTGVPPHNPSQEFLRAMCTALVTVLKVQPIYDIGAGTLDVPGTAVPVPFTFPAIPVATAQLVTTLGLFGPYGSIAASIFIGSTLLNCSKLGLLVMNENLLMGTGAGVVSPASNPGLLATVQAGLQAQLPLAFQATGKFAVDDVPGNPVNPTLLAQLPAYAAALATGVASLTAAVAYVGTASVPTPVAGVINTGFLV